MFIFFWFLFQVYFRGFEKGEGLDLRHETASLAKEMTFFFWALFQDGEISFLLLREKKKK